MEKTISYKGFNGDLTCRKFKYEVGGEYHQKGNIEPCVKGFHACENPFDVLDYYGDILHNRYCEVEQSGIIARGKNKTASSRIKIKAEIGFVGLFKAGIEWLKEATNPAKTIIETKGTLETTNDNGSDHAKIASSGNDAKIGSSGYGAQIASSGHGAQIGSSGDYAKIGLSGNDAKIGLSGNDAKIGSSGEYAKIGSSGYDAQIASSGYDAQIASSGDDVRIGSSGEYAKIGSSGEYAKIGSSGYDAQIASSGDAAQIASSGHGAQIASSGDDARIDSTGENSVICCAGNQSIVKAKKGSWITLSEWEYNKEEKRLAPKCVKTEYVDGERIKEDTWYKLIDGEFVEVKC